MKKRHVIIPIFVPHKGCPFDCIYCNQKTISGQIEEMTTEKMRYVIEEHLSSVDKENTNIEIAFYGGSFTGIEKNQQVGFLKIANEYFDSGVIGGIRLSTRPDYISPEIVEYLQYYNVKTIELGVQSLDNEVLVKSCRGHSIEDVEKASELIRKSGFVLGIQTMIGLPGDNLEKSLATAKKVVALKPEIIRIYPTLVIRNTYLEKLYIGGDYIPLSLEEAVSTCAELLEIYNSNGIKVIRIGLQPSENINNDMDVIAGPFHPAFRQLVESELILKKIINIIKDNNLENEDRIQIITRDNNISEIIGQKKNNIEFLKKRFKFSEIRVSKGNTSQVESMIIKNIEKNPLI